MKVDYDDLLTNYYEKQEIIEKQDIEIYTLNKEIERLTISLQAQEELTMNEHIKVERLNNIIKELALLFDDYMSFIEVLEKYNYKLKGKENKYEI